MSESYPAGAQTNPKEWSAPVRTLQYQPGVAICAECGGKYRPAGGPCIHEHPAPARVTGYAATCGQCGVRWYPGHVCIKQPTAQEVQDLREQAYWLRVMEDVLDHFGYETQLAAPASWEAV